MELTAGRSGRVLARASADQRDRAAKDAVGAPHDLALIADLGSGEKHHELPVRARAPAAELLGRDLPSAAGTVLPGRSGGANAEAASAEREHQHPVLTGTVGANVARNRAPDDVRASRKLRDPGEQLHAGAAITAEDDEQLGHPAIDRQLYGIATGRPRVEVLGPATPAQRVARRAAGPWLTSTVPT